MAQKIITDICIIGGGSGGLSLAAGAAQMGVDVTLIEGHKMGGDCLNYGCVPSKALLAAGHHAHAVRAQTPFGSPPRQIDIDYGRAMAHVRQVIADIEPMDSPARFEGFGVRVIQAPARFMDAHRVRAGDYEVKAKRFVIATGSKAVIPPIKGLADVAYLTNETLFDLRDAPAHLLIIGGGPIGMEMAQAHIRLGCRVSVFEAGGILAREDAAMRAIIRERLMREGVAIYENVQIESVVNVSEGEGGVSEGDGGACRLTLADGSVYGGSHLLIAAGRAAHVEGLDLAAAGVVVNQYGILTDSRLRTNRRHIFAIGDVRGNETGRGAQFTHAANYHAGVALRNIVFHLPAKISETNMPRVTYTDPELAHAGLLEHEARARFGDKVQVLEASFADNDRARAEAEIEGGVKIVLGKRGRVLGVSIVGKGAGDLLTPWLLILGRKLSIGAMAGLTLPYPTRSEAGKRAAGSYYTPSLFGTRMRRIVRLLGVLRR